MNLMKLAMMGGVVMGLLFLAGSGCSKKDKEARAYAEKLRQRLELKEKEMTCKVAALERKCNTGDTACENEKTLALAECNKIGAEADKLFNSTVTVTNTNTNVITSSAVATETGTTTN